MYTIEVLRFGHEATVLMTGPDDARQMLAERVIQHLEASGGSS